MNLTNTLKRIDIFLGVSDADVPAVDALKSTCDDLLTKALEQPESILKEQLESISESEATPMFQTMYEAINSFLQKPSMKQIPLHALAEACKQLVAVYNNTYKLLCQNGDETDRANYERRTYDTLSSALQRKHVELIHDAFEED